MTLHKYIPENLDLDDLLKHSPPSFTKFSKDKLIHIISLLTEVRSFKNNAYENEIGVPLNATKIQHQGIRDFPKYRDWLIENNVIINVRDYNPGETSRVFAFTEKYRLPVKIVHITEKALLRSLTKQSKGQFISKKNYGNLYQWLEGINIDYKSALDYLENDYNIALSNCDRLSFAKYSVNIACIDKIFNKRFRFSIDTSSGRLHHNLTNLKKELRNFISYDGQSLVSLDIKSSQPYMSLLLFDYEFWLSHSSDSRRTNINKDRMEFFKSLLIRETLFFKHYTPNTMAKIASSLSSRVYNDIPKSRK